MSAATGIAAAVAGNRAGPYLGLNAAFLLVLTLGAAFAGGDSPRILYLLLLFGLCSSVIFHLDGLNGRYTILFILMSLYFVYYGAQDVTNTFAGQSSAASGGLLDAAEFAILLGAGGLILGYRGAVGLTGSSSRDIAVNDWSGPAIIWVGLILWGLGLLATGYWQIVIERVQGRTDFDFGVLTGIALVVGRMLQPLGIALLAYRFVVAPNRRLFFLLAAILLIDFALGFVEDSKELSIRGILIVVLAKILIDAKIPKKWLVGLVIIVMLAFPIFQAYRFEVLQEREVDRVAALENIGKSLGTALSSNKLFNSGGGDRDNSRFGYDSALGRISLKNTMELLIAKTGTQVKFQNGHTIGLLAGSLIPRFLYSDKPDTSVGKLFNQEFKISADPDTYISATHLGELYWNFGWAGILVGTPLIGFLLGWVNSRFELRENRSVTRFLILVVTIYFICLRFEGSIALQYTLWIRSIILIGALHWLFARTPAPSDLSTLANPGGNLTGPSGTARPFPNLLP